MYLLVFSWCFCTWFRGGSSPEMIRSQFGVMCKQGNVPKSSCSFIVMYWFRSCLGVPGQSFLYELKITRSSKKRIFRTPLCLARYLPCASTLQPDITCGRLSWAFPHKLHLTSILESIPVLFWWYSFVKSSWSHSSKMPAIV